MPFSHDAFLSEAERGTPNADVALSISWGLSVWRSRDAVDHARSLFRHMRKWHVAMGEPGPTRGVILDTSSNRNPNHYTWWKPVAYDPTPEFQILLEPVST